MKRRDREQPGSLAAHLGMGEAELDAFLDELGAEFGDFTEQPTPAAVVDLESRRQECQSKGSGERGAGMMGSDWTTKERSEHGNA